MKSEEYLIEELANVKRALQDTLRYDYGPDETLVYYKECNERLREIENQIKKVQPHDIWARLNELASLAVWISLIERSRLGEFSWPFAELIRNIARPLLGEINLYGSLIEPIIHVIAEGEGYQIVYEEIPPPSSNCRFVIVAFPRPLKHHVLLHTIFGHELGHAAQDTNAAGALIRTKVHSELSAYGYLNNEANITCWMHDYTAPKEIKDSLSNYGCKYGSPYAFTEFYVERWLEELTCDLFGLLLFGPGFVAAHQALLRATHRTPYEIELSEPSHPPYAIRHKMLLAYLNGVPAWTATTTFSAPLSYSGGAVSIPAASGSTNGYLSSTDWNAFNTKFATTSSDYWISQFGKGFFFSTTSANAWDAAQFRWSTTSTDYWKTANNFFSTTSADAWDVTKNRWATTSATYFESSQWRWSTSSSNYWETTQTRRATTSSAYFLSQNQGAAFSTTSTNYLLNASTTIPRTTLANAWNAVQTFTAGFLSNASSTITSGLFSMNGGASTTDLTAMGNTVLANATTTALFAATASTTNFFGAGLSLCQGGNVLTWASGRFGCAADQSGAAGSAWPFTPSTNYGIAVQATSTPIWATAGLMASSTSYFVNASSTALTVSGTAFFGTATSTTLNANTGKRRVAYRQYAIAKLPRHVQKRLHITGFLNRRRPPHGSQLVVIPRNDRHSLAPGRHQYAAVYRQRRQAHRHLHTDRRLLHRDQHARLALPVREFHFFHG